MSPQYGELRPTSGWDLFVSLGQPTKFHFIFFFPRLISAAAGWMSTILWHMVWPCANLECRSEMCCSRLAANTRHKKSRQKPPSGHHCTTLSGYIFATTAHIDNRKKNFLSSNISSTSPHNMVKFGPLATEIFSLDWGTPGNFNGFRVLAALLHGTLVVGVSQTAALNRGRHLYSTGRPSRWALTHILVVKLLWPLVNILIWISHFT